MVYTPLRFQLHGLWAQCPSRGSSQQNVMPGFPFPAVGPLDIGSPPYRSEPSDHRYYCQLRLPNARLGFVRCSLSAPNTLVAPLLSLTGKARALLSSARTPPHWLTGALDRIAFTKETSGSPKFPGYPLDCMPCSQTPVVSRSLAS
jgi:hypothetical protein